MTGFAVFFLFGSAFAAAVWTLYTSIHPQLYRFAELFGMARPVALPAPSPRLSRVRVRSVPARMPRPRPQRAAA